MMYTVIFHRDSLVLRAGLLWSKTRPIPSIIGTEYQNKMNRLQGWWWTLSLWGSQSRGSTSRVGDALGGVMLQTGGWTR